MDLHGFIGEDNAKVGFHRANQFGTQKDHFRLSFPFSLPATLTLTLIYRNAIVHGTRWRWFRVSCTCEHQQYQSPSRIRSRNASG